ncbi:unnamed protein product [Boreogadus saida]
MTKEKSCKWRRPSDSEDQRGAQWHHLSKCRKADTPGRSWTETLTDLAALQTKGDLSPPQDDRPEYALRDVPGGTPTVYPDPGGNGR